MKRHIAWLLGLLIAADRAWCEEPVKAPRLRSDGTVEVGVVVDVGGRTAENSPESKPVKVSVTVRWSVTLDWGRASPTVATVKGLTPDEQAVLTRTNAERQKSGLKPLVVDTQLMSLARQHAEDMARLDQLSHEPEGRTFSRRLQEAGYKSWAAGENLAEGAPDSQAAVSDWLQSPGHKANLLNDKFTHLGVATAQATSGKRYYAQIFARPMTESPPEPAKTP